jgi:hypothetical protein
MKRLTLAPLVCVVCVSAFGMAQDQKPRVFITDSNSWEVGGAAFGTMNGAYRGNAGHVNGTYGSYTAGGARPQTAEIIKTFGERCHEVIVNNKVEKADYVVVLDHEGGKGLVRRRNKIAVFNRDGDAIVSHSTRSLGNSVKDGCAAILKDWEEHPKTAKTLVRSEDAVSKMETNTGAANHQGDNGAPGSPESIGAAQPGPVASAFSSRPATGGGAPSASPSSSGAPVGQLHTDPARDDSGARQGGYLGATSTQNPRVRHDGVLLSGVEAGGPAYEAGLRAGDVITSIDGIYIYTLAELSSEIHRHAPGSRIQVRYLRGANFYDTYVILAGTARF